MNSLNVSTFPEKQQEVLRLAMSINESGNPVTPKLIAEAHNEGNCAWKADMARVQSTIRALKDKTAWPYNDDGKPGSQYCIFKLIYDEPKTGNGKPVVIDESNVLPITTPAPNEPEDTQDVCPEYYTPRDCERAGEQEFISDLMELFWGLPEPSQVRLWPGIAGLIATIIESK